MSKVLVTEDYLEDIGDAIRSKNGLQTTYKPSQMAGAINALDIASLTTLTATDNGTYTPSAGYNGFSSVSVAIPSVDSTEF